LYRTVIETLQGIAWLLLVFFAFALIAYVLVRSSEWKRKNMSETPKP
jgi:type II secretory pathway component PulF